jgi:hypothetical protein
VIVGVGLVLVAGPELIVGASGGVVSAPLTTGTVEEANGDTFPAGSFCVAVTGLVPRGNGELGVIAYVPVGEHGPVRVCPATDNVTVAPGSQVPVIGINGLVLVAGVGLIVGAKGAVVSGAATTGTVPEANGDTFPDGSFCVAVTGLVPIGNGEVGVIE